MKISKLLADKGIHYSLSSGFTQSKTAEENTKPFVLDTFELKKLNKKARENRLKTKTKTKQEKRDV